MFGYFFGYTLRRTLAIALLLSIAAAPPAAAADTNTWQKVEREFTRYLALEQQAHLQSWQELAAKNLTPHTHENQPSALSVGKAELLQLLAMSAMSDVPWAAPATRQIKAHLNAGKVATKLALNETQQAALLKFLWESHPDPTALTVLEWKAVGTLYGHEVRNTFLLTAFSPEHWNNSRMPASAPPMFQGNTAEVVYVEDGHHWRAAGKELRTVLATTPEADALRGDVRRLASLGLKVHKITLATFPDFDDQARNLQHALANLRKITEAPLILLSSGIASAVVYRWLDIHPQNRNRSDIRAWINWNGRLYGAPPSTATEEMLTVAERNRKKARSPAAESDWNLAASLLQPQQEALVPAIPLGPGFPIFNFVTLHESDRPAENLREAIVPEGKIFVNHERWHKQDLPALLRRALSP